jgi:hypothetical protein
MADAECCPVTRPGRFVPPSGVSYEALFGADSSYGNGQLWVGGLWENGVIIAEPSFVEPDGSIGMKFGWCRVTPGQLTITGQRLDAPAPPARGSAPPWLWRCRLPGQRGVLPDRGLLGDQGHGRIDHAHLRHLRDQALIDFLGDDNWTMASMVAVGVFVSIPFTAYVFLAGLNNIPHDVYEAARIDGATARHIYWRITLPLLRPALLVATVLNMIYVFNSFPHHLHAQRSQPGLQPRHQHHLHVQARLQERRT